MVNFVIFGKRLKKLRLERQMTQQELGDILFITKVSISGYESGNRFPSIDRVCDLADYFNVTTDYLLGRDLLEENKKINLSNDDIEFLTKLKENSKLYEYLLSNIDRRLKNLDKYFNRKYW